MILIPSILIHAISILPLWSYLLLALKGGLSLQIWPKHENDFKYEDYLKYEDSLKYEDDLKYITNQHAKPNLQNQQKQTPKFKFISQIGKSKS